MALGAALTRLEFFGISELPRKYDRMGTLELLL